MKRPRYSKPFYFALLVPVVAVCVFLLFGRSSSSGVVDVDAGTFREFSMGDKFVVRLLSDTIKKNPAARKFRVRYATSRGGGLVFQSEVNYDRQTKELSERSMRSSANHRNFYLGVADANIHRLARRNGALSDIKNGGGFTGIGFTQRSDYLSWLKFRVLNR